MEPKIALGRPTHGVPTVKGFYSLADADRRLARVLVERLDTALATQRAYAFESWNMYDLLAGEDVDKQIASRLAETALGILLLSANFITSPYVAGVELPRLLGQDFKRVVPVSLRALPRSADYLGIDAHQIYGFNRPFESTRDGERTAWVNDLADQIIAIVDKYGEVVP